MFIGIDPGLDGALAGLADSGEPWLFDTPTLTVAGAKSRRDYDIPQMRNYLMRALAGPSSNCRVGIESIHSMPKQGISSTFNFGKGFGIWLGLVVALRMPYELITPQIWKKHFYLRGSDKEASRLKASQLFPSSDLTLKKHHGRAEALLIAEYCRWRYNEER